MNIFSKYIYNIVSIKYNLLCTRTIASAVGVDQHLEGVCGNHIRASSAGNLVMKSQLDDDF